MKTRPTESILAPLPAVVVLRLRLGRIVFPMVVRRRQDDNRRWVAVLDRREGVDGEGIGID